MEYRASDWYWFIGGDKSHVFSSKRNALFPISDVTYLAWGGIPIPIDTLQNLQEVLVSANVPPYAPVTPRQARLALSAAGLLDTVNAAITQAGGATLITWEYATQIRRDDPLITQLGATLGLTTAQIDALFTQAYGL